LLQPAVRSLTVNGTSVTRAPARTARQARSTRKQWRGRRLGELAGAVG
jgi:hypothetical protein